MPTTDLDRNRGTAPQPRVDWRTVGFYVVPFMLMMGVAVALLPQTVATHLASDIWITICAAIGIR